TRSYTSGHARPEEPPRRVERGREDEHRADAGPRRGPPRENGGRLGGRTRGLVADLRARTAAVSERGAGGDEKSIARHRERGKIPVRERIDRLIDPRSAVLPLSSPPAAGL